MIVIFGATGNVGGAAAKELRGRGLPVRAVTRDATKAAPLQAIGCGVVAADLTDARTLERALEGADAALAVCPLNPTAEDVEADASRLLEILARALAVSRPRAVVAISDYGAQHAEGVGITGIFHRLEQTLGATGVPTTFLRSAEHMQNWSRHARIAAKQGVLPSLHHPLTKLFPTVSAFDVGIAAAELLARAEPPRTTRVVHVEGPTRSSAIDVAHVITGFVGRPIEAKALPRDMWEAALTAGRLGPSYARLVAEMQDAHNAGRIDVEQGHGEVLRGATSLRDALALALRT